MIAGIIGVGVVGGTLLKWFKEFTDHKLRLYDPPQGFKDSMDDCDIVFICVPVATKEPGRQDLSILFESIERCPDYIQIVIRSTILPGTADFFASKYTEKLIFHSPEFLTARTAFDSMSGQPIVMGHTSIKRDFEDVFLRKTVHTFTAYEAELGKYFHNILGAACVNVSNIFETHARHHGVNYRNVMDVAQISGHAPKDWMTVPGPDGKFGYGGTCFPKDLKAFRQKVSHFSSTLDAVERDNNFFRNWKG